MGSAQDMQARLSSQPDMGEDEGQADAPAKPPAGSRTDAVDRILTGTRDAVEAVPMMIAEGIVLDEGTALAYLIQRPLEPLPPDGEGKSRTDPYVEVDRIKFAKKPYARQMMKCLNPGEANENGIIMSWIRAFTGASDELLMRLDADDFRLCSHVAHLSYQGNHKSSAASRMH